ncbi:MAG: IreB family regulatory phosphoprotein [Bacillota bacterium]
MSEESYGGCRGTRIFTAKRPRDVAPAQVLAAVYDALEERGYDPVEQITGFLLSGDPTYITEHDGARAMVQRVERDRLLQSLVAYFVGASDPENSIE